MFYDYLYCISLSICVCVVFIDKKGFDSFFLICYINVILVDYEISIGLFVIFNVYFLLIVLFLDKLGVL